jgi:AraC family transcriptional regulator, transcriptional activator of pobA
MQNKKADDLVVSVQLLKTIFPAKRHKRIAFVLLQAGAGRLAINGIEYPIEVNGLYCIPSGQWYRIELAAAAEGFVVLFPEDLLHLGNGAVGFTHRCCLFGLFRRQPCIRLGKEAANIIAGIFSKIGMDTADHFDADMRRAYTGVFMIELARLTESSAKSKVPIDDIQLAEALIGLVESKYLVWKKVSDYAARLQITPNYLSSVLKRVSGSTVGHHIRQQIVLEAKRRARGNNLSLKEISYYLGFKDVAHFSKLFKSVHGQNFTAFRNNM